MLLPFRASRFSNLSGRLGHDSPALLVLLSLLFLLSLLTLSAPSTLSYSSPLPPTPYRATRTLHAPQVRADGEKLRERGQQQMGLGAELEEPVAVAVEEAVAAAVAAAVGVLLAVAVVSWCS